jgi:hypothetical protein
MCCILASISSCTPQSQQMRVCSDQTAEAKIDAATPMGLSSNGVEKFRIHLERHQEIRKLETPSARVPLLRGSELLFCYLEAGAHAILVHGCQRFERELMYCTCKCIGDM